MARFMIEVDHEAEESACTRAIKILLESGSHFLTHADFGCKDGVHRAWIIVEVDTREEARNLVHPYYRQHARVTTLNKFSLEDVDEMLARHQG